VEDEGDGAVGAGGLLSSDPRARFSLLFLLLRVITVFYCFVHAFTV